MRKLAVTAAVALVATLGGISSEANAETAPARTVSDMIGRKVELPPKTVRIACLEVLCYQRMLTLGGADRVVTMTMTAAPWMVATNPRGQRRKMYYLRGPGALNTQGMGSNTFWYSEMAGAGMVVKSLPLGGKGSVDGRHGALEPHVILVGRQYSLDLALKDERFAEIAAVKNGRVHRREGVFYWNGGPESVLLMLYGVS